MSSISKQEKAPLRHIAAGPVSSLCLQLLLGSSLGLDGSLSGLLGRSLGGLLLGALRSLSLVLGGALGLLGGLRLALGGLLGSSLLCGLLTLCVCAPRSRAA